MIAAEGARLALEAIVLEQRRKILAPPPKLTVSQWADRYRKVPAYSAEAGQWVTARTPYLREIMDCFSELGVNRVVFKKCARIGATEAGLNMIGYFIHQDPSAIMIVQPTVDDAKDYSKEQLEPTIADTEVLAERVSSAVKDKRNTILSKTFPGGSLVAGGANSPRFFRRRTVRFVVLEEVNGYSNASNAKKEGDRLRLAEKRTETLGYRRKIYINSTPTEKGDCRISEEFANSDQRYYFVPCPKCGHRQPLVWEQLEYKDRVAPIYRCIAPDCLHEIPEWAKDLMVAEGHWQVTRPGSETRGYHLNALYSPFVSWSSLVREWVAAQNDPAALQVFVNTALGLEWEDRETKDLQEEVKTRALQYEPEGEAWRVPRGACLLVCGVDKQAGELHAVVRAYGPGEESWLVDWNVWYGDTSQPDVWATFETWRLTKTWLHEGGARMPIRATCIDASDDPDPVYSFTRPRLAQYVFAIKGVADPGADIIKKWSKTRLKSRLYPIGTQAIKKRLYRRVGMKAPEPYTLQAGAGFMHFNARGDATYFAEFFSQKLIRSEFRGKSVTMYVKHTGERDEKLDCEVYAYAALQLGPISTAALQAEWERVIAEGEIAKNGPAEPVEPPAPAAATSSRFAYTGGGSWIGRIRGD